MREEIEVVRHARDGMVSEAVGGDSNQEQASKGMGDGKVEGTGEARVAAEGNTSFHLPTPEEMVVQDLFNNCAVRTVMSGVMGGFMGVAFGFMFGALERPLHVENMKTREVLLHGVRTMGSKGYHLGKSFAVMGAIFSGAECVIEKARAKHDMYNSIAAGCVTGGAISASGGPQAACVGCVGFAAFSAVIDKFLQRD